MRAVARRFNVTPRCQSSACRVSAILIATVLIATVLACSGSEDHTRLSDSVESTLPAAGSSSGGADASTRAPEQGAIVFRSDRDQAGIGQLYMMALDGSSVRRLTNGGDYATPVWSPDGEGIAFRRVMGLDAALGLISPGDDEPVLLVTAEDPELWDRVLTWSGDRLIYASRQGGPETDLWVVSRSGGQRRPLFSQRLGGREEADVSRTESRLVFSWNPTEMAGAAHGAAGDQDLWVANGPDDPAPENLTEGRVYVPSGPRWSPDGRTVAFWGFARLADGSIAGLGSHMEGVNPPDADLFLIDVSSHELTQLTDNDDDDVTPSWTPDGKSLIVTSWRDGDEDIWKMPVDSPDQAVNLTEDSDLPSSDSMPDCFWGVPAK